MGFRNGCYAKVWGEPKVFSDTMVKCRISVSRKDKRTGEYENDFSGFVSFIGSVPAKKAASLKEGSRIKLGDVDVSTKYNKETKESYTNFKCFSFEMADGDVDPKKKEVDDGEVENDEEPDNDLPF